MDTLMAALPEALAQLLAHGRLAPGNYDYANPLAELSESGRSRGRVPRRRKGRAR